MKNYIKTILVFIVTILIFFNNQEYKISTEEYIHKDNIKYNENKLDYITKTYCVLRDKPSKSANKIISIDKNNKITLLNKYDTNWYYVKYLDYEGYIQSEYIDNLENIFIDAKGNIITAVSKDNIIICKDNVTEATINYAYNYWYMIPENVRKDFKNQNWSIEITDENLGEKYRLTYNIIGITLPEEKVIKINNSQDSIRKALIHEVGHYIDYRLDFISNSEDFIKIYNDESKKLKDNINNFNKTEFNKKEFFAESFRIYIEDDELQLIINDSIKFIKDRLKEI